jgi:hypothetical protein
MSLERVVRPFQYGDVFTARTIMPTIPPTGIALSDDVCLVTITGENPGEYDDIPDSTIYDNFTVEWSEDVDKRVTETVRIEQEDNPDNFVEVERVQSATMTDARTGRSLTMKFADWDRGRR